MKAMSSFECKPLLTSRKHLPQSQIFRYLPVKIQFFRYLPVKIQFFGQIGIPKMGRSVKKTGRWVEVVNNGYSTQKTGTLGKSDARPS